MDEQEVPERAVHLALKAGEAYLGSKYHDDIENSEIYLVRYSYIRNYIQNTTTYDAAYIVADINCQTPKF